MDTETNSTVIAMYEQIIDQQSAYIAYLQKQLAVMDEVYTNSLIVVSNG